ncbi:MAG: DUF1259 domain-containing protein [Bdellovibrio sp.]
MSTLQVQSVHAELSKLNIIAIEKNTGMKGELKVNHVMSTALDSGLEVTALHNHFFADNPKVMFMHIGGMGTEEKLGASVGKVFSALKESTKEKFPTVTLDSSKTTLNPKIIDTAMGQSGILKDGVYKITIGRVTKMNGHEMGNAMGVNTWAAFIGSDKMAVLHFWGIGSTLDLAKGIKSALDTQNK